MVSCFVRWLFCFFKYWLTSLCACAVLSAWNGRWRSLCSFFIQKFFKLKYIPESEMFFLFAFPCWSAGGLEGLLYQKKPKPPPKNHATLKDTHKMYLTNTGNTKGRGNCLKKYIKIQIIKKKKKILAAAIATTQSLNGCAYGTNLKILGDFLLELSHSKIFLKTSDLDVEITEIQTITLTNLGVHVARLPVAVMKIPHQPFTGEG